MKDIYELLYDVDIDEREMDTMDVSEFEKEKVKRNLRKSLKRNKRWKKKSLVAAALCCAMIGSVGAVGIANPVYAAEIPIVGDIFRLLDNGRTGVYDKYKENVNEINVTKESNGVKITIKDAIFDGKTISYTYEIKSDKDLGEEPCLQRDISTFNIKGYNGGMSGGCDQIKKVNENTYVAQDNITINEERKDISIELNFKGIKIDDFNEVEGKWDFKINLKAVGSVNQFINKGTEKEGVKVNIDNISMTPMSFIVTYSQAVEKELNNKWSSMCLDIEVKDDLGNIYNGKYNGGHGEDEYNFTSNKTFQKLDENATKLIITIKMNLANYKYEIKKDKNGKEVKSKSIRTDESGKETEIESTAIEGTIDEKGEIIFDDIVVDLEK